MRGNNLGESWSLGAITVTWVGCVCVRVPVDRRPHNPTRLALSPEFGCHIDIEELKITTCLFRLRESDQRRVRRTEDWKTNVTTATRHMTEGDK
jgi:hypothetical protein